MGRLFILCQQWRTYHNNHHSNNKLQILEHQTRVFSIGRHNQLAIIPNKIKTYLDKYF